MKSFIATAAAAIATITLFGQAHAAPTVEKRYASGWCGIHVTQNGYTGGDNFFTLNVIVYDADQQQIGETNGNWVSPVSLPSQLPWTIEMSADRDAVGFAYAGDVWDSTDSSRCSVGGWDNNSRQMDCGFTC